jgi:hypothetical protein
VAAAGLRAAALGILVGLSGPVAASADAAERPIVVIVGAAWSEVESVSLAELRDLWLGRRTHLAGERVECLDLPSGSRLRRAFGRAVLGRSERALEEYWIRQALTGGHVPPREVGSAAEVVRAVAERRGSIGYVDAEDLRASPDSGVRVLPLVVDGRALSPTSPDYPIRWLGEAEPTSSAREESGPDARRTPPRPRPPS